MRTNRGLMCLGVAAVAIVLIGSPMASEAGDCVFVEGSITMEQPFTSYNKVYGTAELFIDGLYHPVDVTVTILERKMADDGTEVSLWNIEFDLGDGSSFAGEFHGVIDMSADPWRINSQGKITEGSGAFEDAVGKLVFHGTFVVDWSVPLGILEAETRGKLCDIGFDD